MKNIALIVVAVLGFAANASAKTPKTPAKAVEPANAVEMQKAFASTTTVVLHGIVFGRGRATVKEESRPMLDEIKKLMDLSPELKLSIEVHTDSSGKASANLELSKRQALALRDALVKRGVELRRLSAQGYGDAKPLDVNTTANGRAKNRRVELVKK